MFLGLALFATTLIFRAASANRHVRGRLLASSVAFAACAVAGGGMNYLPLSAELQRQLNGVVPLLVVFGIINGLVALLINPWRVDRVPERFPTIVQDTLVIALFAVAATLILQERIFATTAVGAVVIGFALQDTLGNLFAGLSIQIDKPFRVGHWVNIAGTDGIVSEITWRATKIRTKSGNFVIVPNSALSRDTVTNYSEPIPESRIELEIGAGYDTPPNTVKATILAAIQDEPLVSRSRPPEVLVTDFAASSITYRIRVWIADFAADDTVRDRIRCAVYYAFGRAGIAIPYPIQVEMFKEDLRSAPNPADAERAMEGVEIFASLTDEARGELARAAHQALYAAGEAIVREGEAGSSMFVVTRGEVAVAVGAPARKVARLGPGQVFGEMSLLTGEPRTATVRAERDTDLLEITAEAFRHFVLANPSAVEQISVAVAARSAELEERRAAGAVAVIAAEDHYTFLARVRRFLRLSAV